MATVNFVYNAELGGAIEVRITDKPLKQDGNVMELMLLNLEGETLAKILAEVFSRGVNIGRRHPKLSFKTPPHLTPVV